MSTGAPDLQQSPARTTKADTGLEALRFTSRRDAVSRNRDVRYNSAVSVRSDSRRGFPPAGSHARRCQNSCSAVLSPRKMLRSAFLILATDGISRARKTAFTIAAIL